MSWPDATIAVNLTRAAVKQVPAYNPSLGLNRDHEIYLYRHRGRAGYWAGEVVLENPEVHVIKSAAPGAIHKHT
jgi:hypothetical protein